MHAVHGERDDGRGRGDRNARLIATHSPSWMTPRRLKLTTGDHRQPAAAGVEERRPTEWRETQIGHKRSAALAAGSDLLRSAVDVAQNVEP